MSEYQHPGAEERQRRLSVLGRIFGALVAIGGAWLLFVTAGDPNVTASARQSDTLMGILALVVGGIIAWSCHQRLQRLESDQ